MADEEKTTEVETEVVEEVKNVVTIENSGPCRKKVSIEVPEETVKTALDERYKELHREAIVPGFRKGRAPLRLLEKRFGSDVSQQVKLKLLADASEAALKDNELDTLGESDIDHEKIELPDSGALKFDFEVEVRPEFDLPELEGIAIEKPEVEISDKQIDEYLLGMRKRLGIWKPKEDGTVQIDNQIIADAVLKVEGVEEAEKHDNLEIVVRKNGFVGPVPVENLDDVLKGAKHNDVKKTSIEIPKTFYVEQYRGKKIDVEITVKDIKELEPAELNEDFFNRCGVEDEDRLRELIRNARLEQAQRDTKTAMGDQVCKYLLENTSFDLPADVVADQSMRILQRQYTNLLMRGLERSQIEERMEELRASSENQAHEQLKVLFIMDKIAEKLGVEVSEEEINGHIAQVAAKRGRRPEKVREELAKDGSLAQFSLQVREQKCIEKMLESANITEARTGAKPKKKTAKKTGEKTAKKSSEKTGSKAKKETLRQNTSKRRTKKSGAG